MAQIDGINERELESIALHNRVEVGRARVPQNEFIETNHRPRSPGAEG